MVVEAVNHKGPFASVGNGGGGAHWAGGVQRIARTPGRHPKYSDRQPVPRYRCKACGRYFGSHTGTATYRQHKPKVNALIAKLLCSGVTMRRTAEIVGVSRRTVAKKLGWLAVRARAAHAEYLKKAAYPTSYVQFDEMETYERSKLLPLSIALAVRPKTGYIMGVKVAEMNCHGRPARASVQQYGRRQDARRAAA